MSVQFIYQVAGSVFPLGCLTKHLNKLNMFKTRAISPHLLLSHNFPNSICSSYSETKISHPWLVLALILTGQPIYQQDLLTLSSKLCPDSCATTSTTVSYHLDLGHCHLHLGHKWFHPAARFTHLVISLCCSFFNQFGETDGIILEMAPKIPLKFIQSNTTSDSAVEEILQK